MLLRTKSIMRKTSFIILTSFLVLFNTTLPLFRSTPSDWRQLEDGVDFVVERWMNNKWNIISDKWNQLFKDVQSVEQQKTFCERAIDQLSFGYGFGTSTFGVALLFTGLNDWGSSFYLPFFIGFVLFCMTFIQVFCICIKKLQVVVPFVSLLAILCYLFLLGNLVENPHYELVNWGWIWIILFQLFLIYFFSFDKVSVKKEG